MNTIDKATSNTYLLVLLSIVVAPFLAYQGVLYQTGAEYYHVCWQSQNAHSGPSTPEQAAQWSACRPSAEKAVYGAGFVFAGDPENAVTPALKAVQGVCPSAWTDPYSHAMQMLEEDGGPSLLDHMLPSSWSIAHRFSSQWPRCVATLRANGIPPLEKQTSGEWTFSAPCVPCQDEDRAARNRKAEQDRWDALTEQQKQQKFDAALRELDK